MKKYIYLMLSVVLAGVFGSCSKDNPFGSDDDMAVGQLLTASLDVSLQNEYGPRSLKDRHVRAAAPDVRDFDVAIYPVGKDEPYVTYKYAKMPEIVTLPVGEYRAVASYGDNPISAWDSPYYEGSTGFSIEKDRITDSVEPIECTFANVRVSIFFDDLLKASMAEDCKVTVKVGDEGELDFTTADEGNRSGYFRYVENSTTLTATFTGTVDDVYTTEVKTGIDVAPGKHYQIYFKFHDAGEEDPGAIVPPGHGNVVIVDATVDTENIDGTVDSGESNIPDTMRPQEGEDPGQEGPDKPDVPDTPDDPKAGKPSITANSPFDIDAVNTLNYGDTVELYIKSEAEGGIQDFIVEIVSNVLTEEALEGMLPTVINVGQTPEEYREQLESLNFPTNVNGTSEVTFKLTTFVDAMLAIGTGEQAYYNFVLRVRDANGETVKTFQLRNY